VEPRSEAVAPFVVWRVDVVDGGVSLEPGVCAPNGDARYTRPLAGDDAHTARTPADERALSLLAPFRLVRSLASRGFAYTGRSPLDDEPYRKAARRALVDALCALQGGARVHSARSGRRLLVVGGELSARVTAADGGHLIQAYVGDVAVPQGALPSHLDDAGVFLWLDAANDRIFAASTSRATVAFLRAACEEDVVFPKEANAILLENARALQDVLPITVPESLVPERVRPLATPVLRLTRERADQLFVELLVRLGEAGPLAVPGKGAAHRIDGHHGRPTLLERSLAHEREIAAALSAALAIPDGVSTESLRLVGVPAMLDFLERAKATKAELLWLRDAPIVVESATWGALTLRLRSARDWFGVEGELSLEHGSVPLPAVIRAVRRGERYVALGQGRFAAITDELRERIGAVARASIEHAGGELTIPRFAAPQAAAALHGVASIDAPREWTDLLGRVRAAARREPKLPRGLRGELRSYQLEGFQWMSRLAAWGAGACLADDMGLGKTIQTLALLLDRARLGPAIVIAPTSVASNWEREARRFAPSLRVIPYRGSERGAALSGLGARDVLVMSYEIATRDVDELATLELATLVLDEAHAIKNAETQRTLAVRRLRAGFTLALTGTPIENRLAELYSLMSVLVPGLLGSQESFRTRFVLPIERDRCAESSRALAERIRPFVLRRTKAEVLRELPPRIDITRTAEPGPSERALYEAARRRALAVIANAGDDESSRFQILAELTRLRQLACHPQMLDPRSLVPSAKLEAFMALVEELRAEGHKALVFSQFTKHLDIVERALERADLRVIRLDGSTPAARRGALVDAFQSGEADLFLISLKAGGTGLNLTAANHVIHLDPWWNPAVEDQATDRAHRIGQAQTVTVIRLVSGGTIEETVLALHEQKRELAAAVLEGTATAGKLTTRELAALLDPASMGGQLAEVVPRAARQEGVSIGV
jgi:superfamily II DNA or RNA helicase